METTTFQVEKDSSPDQSFEEPSSPKMERSPSIQRAHGFQGSRLPDVHFGFQGSPEAHSPPNPVENVMPLVVPEMPSSVSQQDSFLMRLTKVPKVDVHSVNDQGSNDSDPESPISRLLTTDPNCERSHSQNFSRPLGQFRDRSFKLREPKISRHHQPSMWRLVELSIPEWLYAFLGGIGAAIFGSFNPLFAYTIALIVAAYYRISDHDVHNEVNKWCLLITCMGIITVVANFLQHFYFGIMGEKMTERVRRMMFSGYLLLYIHSCIFICTHMLHACTFNPKVYDSFLNCK